MKSVFDSRALFGLLIFLIPAIQTLSSNLDSLKHAYFEHVDPVSKIESCINIAEAYRVKSKNQDSLVYYLSVAQNLLKGLTPDSQFAKYYYQISWLGWYNGAAPGLADSLVPIALDLSQDPRLNARIYLLKNYLWDGKIHIDPCRKYLNKVRENIGNDTTHVLMAEYYYRSGVCEFRSNRLIPALQSMLKAKSLLPDAEAELQVHVTREIANVYFGMGAYEQAASIFEEGEFLAKKIEDAWDQLASIYATLPAYYELKRYNKIKTACYRAIRILEKYNYHSRSVKIYSYLGKVAYDQGSLDSAKYFFQKGLEVYQPNRTEVDDVEKANCHLGLSLVLRKKNDLAGAQYHKEQFKSHAHTPEHNQDLAQMYARAGAFQQAYELVIENQILKQKKDSLNNPYELVATLLRESFEKEKQQLAFEKEQELIHERRFQRNILAALGIAVLFSIILAWFYRGKQKANQEILQQKAIVEEQNLQLKATQQQLIQSEKLASLGQLTAGIAHEIKNPLNFITNFAQFTQDLAFELQEGLGKHLEKLGEEDAAIFQGMLEDLQINTAEINQHGKRADEIVESMMSHASGAKGERRTYDINQLINESVRLANTGFKSVQGLNKVEMHLDLANELKPCTLIPQDISRVLVNICNNAYDALIQKQKQLGPTFQPEIKITTHQLKDEIEIRIRDNGLGIPLELQEKIFEPFFTQKDTGKGNTGLGLSISHDIVVQGHHGSLQVESQVGAYAEFVIRLPK